MAPANGTSRPTPPRDFARFGLLYLRDGTWEGTRLLPAGWVEHARTETPASIGRYGAQWWLALAGSGIFTANGFQGQYIVVDPVRDLVVVRLGTRAARARRARPARDRERIPSPFRRRHDERTTRRQCGDRGRRRADAGRYDRQLTRDADPVRARERQGAGRRSQSRVCAGNRRADREGGRCRYGP
jgi:CubicO group peptidase (beta-lactamase class C family)